MLLEINSQLQLLGDDDGQRHLDLLRIGLNVGAVHQLVVFIVELVVQHLGNGLRGVVVFQHHLGITDGSNVLLLAADLKGGRGDLQLTAGVSLRHGADLLAADVDGLAVQLADVHLHHVGGGGGGGDLPPQSAGIKNIGRNPLHARLRNVGEVRLNQDLILVQLGNIPPGALDR